jgi:hypothetical protein
MEAMDAADAVGAMDAAGGAAEGRRVTVVEVGAAVRWLRGRAERREEAAFTRRGYEGVKDFYGRFLRLSAVAVVTDGMSEKGALWLNAEARHPLAREVANALGRCLVGG